MPTETDARGRQVVLEQVPRRIVSLVPSQTELLAFLGLDDKVVGITRFCERPEGWRKQKTIVGGTKQVDTDTVRGLNPDLVLANYEENTPDDVAALDEIAPVFVTDVQTVPDACDMIRTVGTLTHTTHKTSTLVGTIVSRFDKLPDFPPLRALYLIWREPYMAVGGDTFIHDVMDRGGFVNVCGDRTRYPEVELSTVSTLNPDVVLCSSEPFPFHEKAKFTADLQATLSDTPLEIVDGQPFSWYGPRLLNTPAYLKDLREQLAVGQAA